MSKRVMVVDGHGAARRSVTNLLNKWGYKVTEAGNEEAIRTIEREDFDLLILDVAAPTTDRMEALETAKSNRNKDIPVIALIGTGNEDEFVKVCDSEKSHYITKPFTPTQLLYGIRLMFGEAGTYWKA